MNMKRKTIVTVALLCVTLCVPLAVFSQSSDFEMNGTVLVRYNGSAANVVIPAGVTSIEYAAFRWNKSLTSVTIHAGVNFIATSTFEGCTSLTDIIVDIQNNKYSSVEGVLFSKDRSQLLRYPAGKQSISYNIPAGVTSIEWEAFEECTGITSVTIPASVTSIAISNYYGASGFAVCTSLTNIIVDTQNNEYSSVEGVLFSKDRTQLLLYPAGKQGNYTIPTGVTSIENHAFAVCTGLTSVTIPTGVTAIKGAAFIGCTGLTSVIISEGVTSIEWAAFAGCDSLISINIPSSVTSIGWGAFACPSLPSSVREDIIERFGEDPFRSPGGAG